MTTHAAPARSASQRWEALTRANRVRSERSAFKASLRRLDRTQARRMAYACVERPPWWACSWHVADLLVGLPGWGPVKVAKAMRRCGIPDSKHLAALTDRQREALLGELEA